MTQYTVEPEVAGSLGDKTQGDFSKHPPIIEKLHFQFDGWLGDDLLESFPCFVVTSSFAEALSSSKLTGFELQQVVITVSDTFEEVCGSKVLPSFSWLKVCGVSGEDDFSLNEDGIFLASESAMRLMLGFNLKNAEITEY